MAKLREAQWFRFPVQNFDESDPGAVKGSSWSTKWGQRRIIAGPAGWEDKLLTLQAGASTNPDNPLPLTEAQLPARAMWRVDAFDPVDGAQTDTIYVDLSGEFLIRKYWGGNEATPEGIYGHKYPHWRVGQSTWRWWAQKVWTQTKSGWIKTFDLHLY